MSCHRNANQVAEAACIGGGIPQTVSQKTFYLGAVTAGLLTLSGLLVSRRLLRQSRKLFSKSPEPLPSESLSAQDKMSPLKTLRGQQRIEPILADKLSDQQCSKCKAVPGHKSGSWYRLQSQFYCQDCAQEKAEETGTSLVLPPTFSTSTPQTSGTTPASKPSWTNRRRVTLKPSWVSLGALQNVEGYDVLLASGVRTGLTITPEVKITEEGTVQINKMRWFVNYERAGKAIGGPYESVNQARGMASIMAQFNWNRPVESFTEQEAQAIKRAANVYRADLDEEKIIKERAKHFFAS